MEASPFAGCSECRELIRAYRDTARKLAPLTKELSAAAAGYEWDLFARMWNRVTLAKEKCESAREALRLHMAARHTN
jgi:outer membrane protein TolC